MERARIDPTEVDDVVLGASLQQGVTGDYRPHGRTSRGTAGYGGWHVNRSPMRIWSDGDFYSS
jgi:hypothetical protein